MDEILFKKWLLTVYSDDTGGVDCHIYKIFNYFMMDLEKILKKNNYKIQSNIFKDYFASHIYQQQQYS